MSKLKNLTGKKFGKLTVIERAENDSQGNAQWLCKCDCGNKKVVRGYQLTSNKTRSCGCLREISCVSGIKQWLQQESEG